MRISLQMIHNCIALYYNVDEDYIFSKTRKTEAVRMRQMFFYLSRELNGGSISYEVIGKYYLWKGRKWHHSTVMHACKIIDFERKMYEHVRVDIEKITQMCLMRVNPISIDLLQEKMKLITKIVQSIDVDELITVVNQSATELKRNTDLMYICRSTTAE